LEQENRAATESEQMVLGRWSSWGALPNVFNEDDTTWSVERAQLTALLSPAEFAEARRTTINAHYTDPAYVRQVWASLTRLGFTGGDVLEPGSGAGTFIGMAPAGTRMVGVELDSTTATISRGLYPQAEIRTESFADTRYPRGHFDASVGNVPFANVTLHDPVFNLGRHSMHNHFIIKSLALTRPGGMVAVFTSAFTMDSVSSSARQEMNALADLVGAVRMPSGAFRRSAGTEALTDLLIFRVREPGTAPRDVSWESLSTHLVDGETIHTNTYFDAHPDHVLGTYQVGTGMYGAATVLVKADLTTTATALGSALEDITARAVASGTVFTQASTDERQARLENVAAQTDLWDGTLIVGPSNTFQVVKDGLIAPLAVPSTNIRELGLLLGLRDGARKLLEAEAATGENTPQIDTQRLALRTAYDAYKTQYGPLNRYTLSPVGKADEVTGERVMARRVPRPIVILRQDPFGPLVMALERFDDETQAAAHATMLTERVITVRAVAERADSPADAIALSADQTGTVDLPLIAQLLGEDEGTARLMLGTLAYDDPATGSLVAAAEYLSGNVRQKLTAALEAADTDPAMAVNVEALRAVMPVPIGIEEIKATMGAVWIDAATHQQFLEDILLDTSVRVENPMPGMWEVRGVRTGVKATNEWGTERRPATDIAQSVMEQKPILVKDVIEHNGSTREVHNPIETTAALEKAEQMQTRFQDWVWEDPARAAHLGEVYNERFNSIVLRDYTAGGDHLTLPDLATNFEPRPHQLAAVARMIAEPAVGLFHQVGAGKTAEMVIGAHELKRMGLVRKPVVVIPNHMLEQFTREWLQLYPQARVLATSSADLSGDKRRLFVARAAMNDWDAVIMTQSAFERVPLSADFEQRYVETKVDELRNVLAEVTDSGAMSIKRVEKAVLKLEGRLKDKMNADRERGISFEQTGIDYIIVDEAHMFKNLATTSNIQGAAIGGADRATDLDMKMGYVRDTFGGRVGTMATATPLTNSVTEAYIMQRYMRPDLLEQAGVTSFDGWAATFGQQVTEMEMSPAGGFKLKTRFAKFQNVPEMLRMWHVFADVKTAEDLQLPVPLIAARASDGQRLPENIVLQATAEVRAYITDIGERAEKVANRQVPPTEDNMLKISTDGRKAALDIRLVDQHETPTGPVKLDAVAAHIMTVWRANADNIYLDDVTHETSPIRGGMQLVFSDIGTPNQHRWNAYDELKLKLVDAGMPAGAIRFIHEAKNDSEKARLFAAARSGHVAVLVGSTAKMGVGTNVQSRLTAMHHIDVPWRPSDVEQRDGRGIRQGNQNAEVAIFRYIVENSFDAFSWQTIARKATFINQIMKGSLDSREIEDIGDTALSAAEAKALASGNPLMLEKANADTGLQKLRRQEIAHHRGQASLRHTIEASERTILVNTDNIRQLETAATLTQDVSGDHFRMVIAGTSYNTRTDAADAIVHWGRDKSLQYANVYKPQTHTIGTLAGHTITATAVPGLGYGQNNRPPVDVVLAIEGVPLTESRISAADFLTGGVGLVRQLENKTLALPHTITRLVTANAEQLTRGEQARERVGIPFRYIAELAAAHTRVDDINQALSDYVAAQNQTPTPEPEPEPEPVIEEPVITEPPITAGRNHDQDTETTTSLDERRKEAAARLDALLDAEPNHTQRDRNWDIGPSERSHGIQL